MSIARPIARPIARTVAVPLTGGTSGLFASANARTFTLAGGTRQIILDNLLADLNIRWITPTQTEPVGTYLYDAQIQIFAGKQVIAVPVDATAFSYMTATGVVVGLDLTESVQAAPMLRSDIVTDISTITTTSAAVAAYQGSVTPAADAGRFLNGWHTKNIIDNAADMTAWTKSGGTVAVTDAGEIDGIQAWLCDVGDFNDDVIYETNTGGIGDGERMLATIKLRAVEAADVGDIYCIKLEKGSGVGVASKAYVPLTMAWQEVYIDLTLDAGDTGYKLSIRRDASTATGTLYAADPQIELVEGLTTVLASPYEDDNLDHWSEYHPTASMVSMSPFWLDSLGGAASELGLVFRSPVKRAIGSIDITRTPHLAGAPNIGARA